MGLANLVPGISGGTMLLAAGVYPQFIEGIAEVTTLKFERRTLITLALIVGSAALAILLGAGAIKGLVVGYRWTMYSLFIGLTLGGVPIVWRMVRPLTGSAVIACAGGVLLMAAMALTPPSATLPGAEVSYGMLFLAGLAGASAMILPGISGGYLLLVLGQYLVILGAIERAKMAILNPSGWDLAALLEPLHVFIPVGLGVAAGIVGVSNLIRILLARYEKPALGLLLGLLFGAVLGLWPFQEGVRPVAGDVIKGQAMTAELIERLKLEDYPQRRFTPSASQTAAALALIAAGFALTQLVAKAGRPSSAR